jgi:hypothetical protein
MSTGKSIITQTNFASKKLLGKAHTSNLKTDVNESIPSNVSIPSKTVFGEDIPNNPGTQMYTLYSASAGGPATVERVFLDIVSISDTIYDADTATSGGGGSGESSESGPHGYYLKLPSNYASTSSNPNKGSGVFTNGKRIYDSRGELQLVPPLISNASPNNYFIKLYKGDPTNPANEITSGDIIDWQFDYYSGIIFIQDYSSTKVPLTASAYLYVGKYLDDKINDISGSSGGGGGIFTEINASKAFTTSSINVGANATPTHTLEVKGTTLLSGGVIHKRTTKSSNYTVTVSDYYVGGNSTGGAFTFALPDASTSTSGQTWVFKDEGGSADTNGITISASAYGQTIDGENTVVLESSYASIQVYSNGVDKFYIF